MAINRIDIITHMANLVTLSSVPVRNRTERQQTDYNNSLEFVRTNVIAVYAEYYARLEKDLEGYEVPVDRVEQVLNKTNEVFSTSVLPDKYVLVDAINIVRSSLSSVAGLLEELTVVEEYFKGELDRLDKVFSLFINTDKGWVASAFSEILRGEGTNKKISDISKAVTLLTMRHDSLDKEFRALSRMLGAIMSDDVKSERPKVIAQPFLDIVNK